jgi:hypothetical protein
MTKVCTCSVPWIFKNIFDLRVVESADREPMHTKGWLNLFEVHCAHYGIITMKPPHKKNNTLETNTCDAH